MGVGGVWMFLFYEVQEPAGGPLLAAQRRVDHCFLIVSFHRMCAVRPTVGPERSNKTPRLISEPNGRHQICIGSIASGVSLSCWTRRRSGKEPHREPH